MANFFEDVGRSGAVARGTKQLTDTALNIRRQALAGREMDMREESSEITNAINREQLSQLRQENKRKNTIVPLNIARQAFDNPDVAQYAEQKLRGMGLIDEVSPGNEGMTVGNAEKAMQILLDPKNPYAQEMSVIRLNSLSKGIGQLDQAIAQEKNPKKLEELQQQKQALGRRHAMALNQTSMAKEVSDLTKAGYDQEQIQEFLETGDRGVLEAPEEESGATPTDIDDFVSDAVAEAERLGGELTPGQRNKARLEFKRAQAAEVGANRLAERTVDAETAEKIKFNGETGVQLARIATAAELARAEGKVTPADKITTAKKRMSGNLAKLANHYVTLDSTGAMLNVDNTTFDNIMAAARSSTVGQMFGRITGSNEQSIRSSINKIKPLLIQDIRQSTDMGARGLDSEKELEFYLQAASDEKTDIQSNIAAIVVLDEAFGEGLVANQLRSMTNESLIQRISNEGQIILGGGEAPKETDTVMRFDAQGNPIGQ